MAYLVPPSPPQPPAPPTPPVPPTPQNTAWAQEINADAAAGLLTNANIQAAANGQQVPTFTDPAQILNAVKAGVMPDSYLPVAEQQVASAGLPVTASTTPTAPTDQTKTPAMRTASSPSDSSGALPTTTTSTPTQYSPFLTSNPGTAGTSYGQASSNLISQAQQENPALATALQNGTAQLNYNADTGTSYLVDTSTGQQIGGNYTVTSTPDGQTAINIPTSGGAMLQAVAGTASSGNGMLSPVTANNVFNTGLNAGAGGFAGGTGALMTAGEPALAIAFPALVPYIAAYNAANAANKGQYGAALLNAAVSYAGFNPNSTIATTLQNLVSNGEPVDPSTGTGGAAPTTPSTSSTETPISGMDNPALNAGENVYPSTGNIGALPSSNALTDAGIPSVNTSSFMNTALPGDLNITPETPLGSGLAGTGVPIIPSTAAAPLLGSPTYSNGTPAPNYTPEANKLGAPMDANGVPITSTPSTVSLSDAAAAAKVASSLLNSSSGTPSNSVPSGGTTGGSSSGPWNSPLTSGAVVLGSSKFPGFTDPLAGLLNNTAPASTGSGSLIDNILAREYAGELGGVTQGYAKGGKVEEHINKLEPEYVAIIKERLKSDKSHPNYNGLPLFRTGGLGKHVQGPGTGQSDDIPAMLADGEYVFDADTVSALGDGSNKAGASVLDKMREAIRKHKRSAPIDKIPPKAKSPLEYLRGKS